ncbi:unnamed protein product, partial [Rhizoctonia solani]
MEWLGGTGSHAIAKELWAKRDVIGAMEKTIWNRCKEAETGSQELRDQLYLPPNYSSRLLRKPAPRSRRSMWCSKQTTRTARPDAQKIPKHVYPVLVRDEFEGVKLQGTTVQKLTKRRPQVGAAVKKLKLEMGLYGFRT